MRLLISCLAILLLTATTPVRSAGDDEHLPQPATYSKNEILQAIESFFGTGAKDLGKVVEKAFHDNGEPNAYIAGNEVAAALAVGARYGKGTLQTKNGFRQTLYWQGPSIGFDIGANASKVFVLIYHLPSVSAIYQRYPGIEGSLYFVGGIGMNYLQIDDTVIAPIRFGAGWRQGISAGYMDFTRNMSLNPF